MPSPKKTKSATPAKRRGKALDELPIERQERKLRAEIRVQLLKHQKKELPQALAEGARGRRGYQAAYRGAAATRFSQGGWNRGGGGGGGGNGGISYRGGTASDRFDLGTMRNRGRYADRENVIAHSFLITETDYVAGDGLGLQMQAKNADGTVAKAFNAEIETRFWKWLETADVSGRRTAADWFRDSWKSPRRDGDGGILLAMQGGQLRLQYISGDLIRDPLGSKVTRTPLGSDEGTDPNLWTEYDRKNTFDGVQCDPAGKPERFWIRDVDEEGKDTTSPVEARDFVYFAFVDEDNAVRGKTVFARLFDLLDQCETYIDAVTKAAIMAAIFGLIEKRKNPEQTLSSLGVEQNAAGDWQKAISLENGQLKVIGPEDSIFQVEAQQPVVGTSDFVRVLVRIMGLEFQMPIEIAMKDLSQVNFSGGRIGLLGFYRNCRIKCGWLKSKWARIVRRYLEWEKQRQELGFPDAVKNPFPAEYAEFELHGREYEANDRKAEAEADLLEFCLGKPIQKIFQERSWDFEKDFGQWVEHFKNMAAVGAPVLLSNLTRDAVTKVTAVDAEGNPISGSAPLNGVQITAAMEVLTRLAENTLPKSAAVTMLSKLGIDPATSAEIATASEANRSGVTASDREFQRSILLKLLDVAGAKQTVFNLVDIEDMIAQSGLPPEQGEGGKKPVAPYLPVETDQGQLVDGTAVTDPEGDVFSGGVVAGSGGPGGAGGGGGAGASGGDGGDRSGGDPAGISRAKSFTSGAEPPVV